MTKTEEFIQKAKLVHGDKYDYSKVEYINSSTKVIIICQMHSEFEQVPSSHLCGRGCPTCAIINRSNNQKLSLTTFIQKAKLIHGDKYDYSKVEYINNHTKVIIICPDHGEFEQQPANHLNSNGCSKCVNNIKLTTTDFLLKAKEIHGDKYDYSKVEYIGIFNHVKIICPIHGEFEQTPRQHLKGRGCYKCGGTKKYTQTEFIIRAKEIHENKYDYSKVNYLGGKKDIIIICPKHGEFKQKAGQHIHGSGCPNCVGLGLTYLSYEDAKIFVRNLGIKSGEEYERWWDENKPNFLPKTISIYYKNNF